VVASKVPKEILARAVEVKIYSATLPARACQRRSDRRHVLDLY